MNLTPRSEIVGKMESKIGVVGIARDREYTSFEQIFEQTAIAELFDAAQKAAEEKHDARQIEVVKSLRDTSRYAMQCLYNAVGVEHAMKQSGLFFEPHMPNYPSVEQEREYLKESITTLTRNVFISEMLAAGKGEVLKRMTYAAMDNEELAERLTDSALTDIREYYPYAFKKAQSLAATDGKIVDSESLLRD